MKVIGTVGFVPNVRVIGTKMGNVPERISWKSRCRTPGATHPSTYYAGRNDYDAAGNLVRRTDRSGDGTTYSYDANRRLVSKTRTGGFVTTFGYDQFGRLVSLANPDSVITFGYDDAGDW